MSGPQRDVQKSYIVGLKNSAQNERYVSGIFANEENERRIKHAFKVDYI